MGRESLELCGEAQSAARTPKALPPQWTHSCQATAKAFFLEKPGEASAYFITACTSSKQGTGTWMENTEKKKSIGWVSLQHVIVFKHDHHQNITMTEQILPLGAGKSKFGSILTQVAKPRRFTKDLVISNTF